MFKVMTAFSGGFGSIEFSLKYENIEHEIVAACEWMDPQRKSYLLNHGKPTSNFYKDIRDMDGTKYKGEIDLYHLSPPCQSYSLAGSRGGAADERGGLMFEAIKSIDEVQPRMFTIENVKGLMSSNGGEDWNNILKDVRSLKGYSVSYGVMNAKHQGTPQNRERLFIVGFRGDARMMPFPPIIKLDKCLADVLEDVVDEKYYLSDKMINCFKVHGDRHTEKGNGFAMKPKEKDDIANCISTKSGTRATDNFVKGLNQVGNIDTKGHNSLWDRVYDTNGIAPTQNANGGGAGAKTGLFRVKSNTKQGYEEAVDGVSINLTFPKSKTRRGRVGKQVAQTLDCACNQGVVLDTETKKEYNGIKKDCNAQRTPAETNTIKILRVLWNKAREKALSKGEFGEFTTLQQEEIMQRRLSGEELCESWGASNKIFSSSPYITEHEKAFYKEGLLREMWKNWEDGYSSHRRELSKQLTGKLDDIVQKLSHEDTQTKTDMQSVGVRHESQRSRILREALSEIQKMGESVQSEEQSVHESHRIRRLTPREASRIQGDFQDMFKFGDASDTKLYEFIGNAMDISTTRNLLKTIFAHKVDFGKPQEPSFVRSEPTITSLFEMETA